MTNLQSKLFEKVSIKGKYKNAFLRYVRLEKINDKKVYRKKVNIIYFFLKVCFGIIISFFRNYKTIIHNKEKSNNKSYLFITHYSPIVKLKALTGASELNNFEIIYLPTLHFSSERDHKTAFLDNDPVRFDSYKLSSIFTLGFFLIRNYYLLIQLKKENIESFFPYLKGIVKYLIIKDFSEKLVKEFNKSTVWICDGDVDPSFIALIKTVEENGMKSVSLQHGSFFSGNKFYLPSICDYVFACSEREKELFVKEGAFNENIFVIGAPLQVFAHDEVFFKKSKLNYDILILLTDTNSENSFSAQKQLLNELSQLVKLKILIRFRPASFENDFIKLNDFIGKNMIVSNDTLSNDIHNSKAVITFSFDAMYNCLIQKKGILLIGDLPCVNELKKSNSLLTIDYNGINTINSTLNNLKFNGNDSNLIWNFGEYSRDIVFNNLIKAIESIQNV